jgi:hypothetical protein
MKVESINFLSSIEGIEDIFDYSMGVSINLKNGLNCV